MKKEIIYLRICCVAFLIAILWGYAAPALISAPDDILVFLGAVIGLATPVFAWWIIKPIFKSKKINIKKEEK